MYLQEGLCGVSGVRPDDQAGVLAPLHHTLLQLVPPDVLTGLEDVVAVADHSHRAGGELIQQPLEGLLLSAPTPGDDGATDRQRERERERETQSESERERKRENLSDSAIQ